MNLAVFLTFLLRAKNIFEDFSGIVGVPISFTIRLLNIKGGGKISATSVSTGAIIFIPFTEC